MGGAGLHGGPDWLIHGIVSGHLLGVMTQHVWVAGGLRLVAGGHAHGVLGGRPHGVLLLLLLRHLRVLGGRGLVGLD